jgi:hypothetical protein
LRWRHKRFEPGLALYGPHLRPVLSDKTHNPVHLFINTLNTNRARHNHADGGDLFQKLLPTCGPKPTGTADLLLAAD